MKITALVLVLVFSATAAVACPTTSARQKTHKEALVGEAVRATHVSDDPRDEMLQGRGVLEGDAVRHGPDPKPVEAADPHAPVG